MAVRSPSLDPLLTIHGAGSQQTESATSVSKMQMAPRWISYTLGKRGDAHDSLQGRLAATDCPRASWGNDCPAGCEFGLSRGTGTETFMGERHRALPLWYGTGRPGTTCSR